MTPSNPDIHHAEDIDRLVAHFYQKVLDDAIIGFFFTELARIDLPQHLVVISQFWQRQLLGQGHYHGRPFEVHQQLHQQARLTHHHFHRWVFLFHQSVDALFCGKRAELAKQRASSIADAMHQGLHDPRRQQQLQQREQSGVMVFEPNNSMDT